MLFQTYPSISELSLTTSHGMFSHTYIASCSTTQSDEWREKPKVIDLHIDNQSCCIDSYMATLGRDTGLLACCLTPCKAARYLVLEPPGKSQQCVGTWKTSTPSSQMRTHIYNRAVGVLRKIKSNIHLLRAQKSFLWKNKNKLLLFLTHTEPHSTMKITSHSKMKWIWHWNSSSANKQDVTCKEELI